MNAFLFSLFADAATPGAQPQQAPLPSTDLTQTLVMIGVAFLFFYMILWRPEQKRRKAQDALRSSMKKGDKVTAMGIVGTVSKVNEQTVIIEMVDGSKIEMLKAAVSDVSPSGAAEVKKA
jgi:preprotein translocase subunit YajC